MNQESAGRGARKEIPKKIGLFGLALLLSLAEKSGVIIANILEGPRLSMSKGLDRIYNQKTLGEWYELLKEMDKNSARTILWRLEKKGLVRKKGKRYFTSKLGLRFIQNQENSEWDGKWRLVAFDIPEKNRESRDWLRTRLRSTGYKQLQKSLFVSKKPIGSELMKEIIERGLYKNVRIVVVGEIDEESFFESSQ